MTGGAHAGRLIERSNSRGHRPRGITRRASRASRGGSGGWSKPITTRHLDEYVMPSSVRRIAVGRSGMSFGTCRAGTAQMTASVLIAWLSTNTSVAIPSWTSTRRTGVETRMASAQASARVAAPCFGT